LTEYIVLYGYKTHRDVFSEVGAFTSAFTFTFYDVFFAIACRGLFEAASSTTHIRYIRYTRSFLYWRDCSTNIHKMKQPGMYYHTICVDYIQ